MIDLSSDTATRPSAEMRHFMANAEVGDEQFRRDPTVNKLQEMVAELTGKEASLFLPSGTMCNVIAFAVHCQAGDAVILDRTAHPYTSEGGGPAVFARVMMRTVEGVRGVYGAREVIPHVTAKGTHASRSRMISVENTTNFGGGKFWPTDKLAELRTVCNGSNMILHMDGARLMNAVVASGTSAKEYASYVDSLWIDLSKGLGCPVGGILVGSKDFIEEARFWKHRLGGAMRQAGIIAAAGVFAFERNVDRLAEDHANAKFLEAGIAEIPGITMVNGPVETNIVLFDITGTGLAAEEINRRCEAEGVRLSAYNFGSNMRAVTHMDVTRADCDKALQVLKSVVTAA